MEGEEIGWGWCVRGGRFCKRPPLWRFGGCVNDFFFGGGAVSCCRVDDNNYDREEEDDGVLLFGTTGPRGVVYRSC